MPKPGTSESRPRAHRLGPVAQFGQSVRVTLSGGGVFGGAGANNRRGFWRIVPVDMRITIIVTDQSGGSGNNFAFDTVIHEGLGLI